MPDTETSACRKLDTRISACFKLDCRNQCMPLAIHRTSAFLELDTGTTACLQLDTGISACLSYFRTVFYHSGGSMELNACILLLAHMVYL